MVDAVVTETKIELVDDTQVLNEDFKKNVAIPYFKDIYKDLVQQSDNKSKGINKLSILTVSLRREEGNKICSNLSLKDNPSGYNCGVKRISGSKG